MNCQRHYQMRIDGDVVTIVYRLHAGLRAVRGTNDHDLALSQEMDRIVRLLHKDIKPRKAYSAQPCVLSDGIISTVVAFHYPKSCLPILGRRLQLFAFEQLDAVCT